MQAVLLALLLAGAAAGAYTSLRLRPYSALSPKHVYVQHLVRHEGGRVLQERWDLAATDAVSPAVVLGALGKGVSWESSPPDSWQVGLPDLRTSQGSRVQGQGSGLSGFSGSCWASWAKRCAGEVPARQLAGDLLALCSRVQDKGFSSFGGQVLQECWDLAGTDAVSPAVVRAYTLSRCQRAGAAPSRGTAGERDAAGPATPPAQNRGPAAAGARQGRAHAARPGACGLAQVGAWSGFRVQGIGVVMLPGLAPAGSRWRVHGQGSGFKGWGWSCCQAWRLRARAGGCTARFRVSASAARASKCSLLCCSHAFGGGI